MNEFTTLLILQILQLFAVPIYQVILYFVISEFRATNCCRQSHVFDYLRRYFREKQNENSETILPLVNSDSIDNLPSTNLPQNNKTTTDFTIDIPIQINNSGHQSNSNLTCKIIPQQNTVISNNQESRNTTLPILNDKNPIIGKYNKPI